MTSQLLTAVRQDEIMSAGGGTVLLPALIPPAGAPTRIRFLEFFRANMRNPHTRRACARAAQEFLAWCADRGLLLTASVQPLHVAARIEQQAQTLAAPSVKQRLALLRRYFDWLVTGQVVPLHSAASVLGPSHVVRRGETPVLAPAEARALLGSIDVTTLVGVRDLALMVYSFARIGAALGMKVEDVYTQNRRLWVRLSDKGGKAHTMPRHHSLETYLTMYTDGAGLDKDPKGPLFRTIGRAKGRPLTRTALPQANAYTMIRQRAVAAGIAAGPSILWH